MTENEKYKPVYETRMYCRHTHPFAYATITNFEDRKGLLQIHSDWGTYSNFWGAIGDRTMEDFLISASASYIEEKLKSQMRFMGCKVEAYGRLTKFMAQCWPGLLEIIKDCK